jgi:hypothetical protein
LKSTGRESASTDVQISKPDLLENNIIESCKEEIFAVPAQEITVTNDMMSKNTT